MKKLLTAKGVSLDRTVLGMVVVWWAAINAFAYTVFNRFHLEPDTAYLWMRHHSIWPEPSWDFIGMHARWDSGWYLDIVQHGYQYLGPGELANIVFFPLYPFLMKVVGIALAESYVLAGWLISSVALVGAAVMLARLVRDFHPKADPIFAVVAMLVFPTAIFLNAVYTESFFLLLSISAVYAVRKRAYGVAGVLGLLAALTRVTGVLLTIPLVWEYWREHGYRVSAFLKPKFLPLALPPLGTLGFFAYHYIAFGDPFLFLKVESSWGRSFNINEDHFDFSTHAATTNFALDLMFVAFALAMVAFVMWKVRLSYGLYMIATLAVALSTGTMMSIGRYILVLFPMFIAIAYVKAPHLRFGWLLTSILLLALYTTLFVHGLWAG
ncbi:MAG: mannosyltransferase family protein [Candidatus Spechtbacterales bacterium]